MVRTAPVYRSHRLHAINPTAAVSDDVSYLYTLVRWGTGLMACAWRGHDVPTGDEWGGRCTWVTGEQAVRGAATRCYLPDLLAKDMTGDMGMGQDVRTTTSCQGGAEVMDRNDKLPSILCVSCEALIKVMHQSP